MRQGFKPLADCRNMTNLGLWDYCRNMANLGRSDYCWNMANLRLWKSRTVGARQLANALT
jgi:hypothetical protein